MSDLCVNLSPVDLLVGITYKKLFNRLHLLNYKSQQAKYFIHRSHERYLSTFPQKT